MTSKVKRKHSAEQARLLQKHSKKIIPPLKWNQNFD